VEAHLAVVGDLDAVADRERLFDGVVDAAIEAKSARPSAPAMLLHTIPLKSERSKGAYWLRRRWWLADHDL
jgi:hypothetical protein